MFQHFLNAMFLSILGLYVSAMLVTPESIPACKSESTTTQKVCHWDADKQGNGKGLSFTLYDYGARIVIDN